MCRWPCKWSGMCQQISTAYSHSYSGRGVQAELAKMPAVGQAMPPELQAERQTKEREARQLDMQARLLPLIMAALQFACGILQERCHVGAVSAERLMLALECALTSVLRVDCSMEAAHARVGPLRFSSPGLLHMLAPSASDMDKP